MLKVTEAAVERLNEILEEAGADNSRGIRLLERDAQLDLQIDTPNDGDQIVSAGERPVLMIDADLASVLDGAMLDSVVTADGEQFRLMGLEDTRAGAPPENGSH